MNTHHLPASFRPRNLIRFVFALSVVGVFVCGLVPGRAQDAAREGATAPAAEGREWKDTIPAHVPLKVKLKSEGTFKDVRNKDWARELELEVKNTGSKPIYFMYLLVVMPEMVNNQGHALTFQLHYGRKGLVRYDAPLQPDDVPILPGESITLKVSENQVKGFEAGRHKEKTDNPKKVVFEMQLINFGDSTGIQGTKGTPMPDPSRQRSLYAPSSKDGPNYGPPIPEARGEGSCRYAL